MDDPSSLKVVKRGTREIVITRDFDAARGRVFDAWTKPDVLRRWFGPKGWSLVVCDVEARPERFVYTQTFEMEDFLYPTQELRDGDIAPTEHGATESYAKLDEYFACTPTK